VQALASRLEPRLQLQALTVHLHTRLMIGSHSPFHMSFFMFSTNLALEEISSVTPKVKYLATLA
jgi:hypothetical protein